MPKRKLLLSLACLGLVALVSSVVLYKFVWLHPDINGPGVPVVRDIDGDTIVVDIDGRQEKIRYLGINTPETVDPRKPVQCFGHEASNRMKSLLKGGRVVLVASPNREDRDKYGRLLRYVELPDGTDLNLKMLQDGYAYEYTFGTPYSRQDAYRAAEASARAANRGLWSPQTCDGRL
jgi:micrococcal nuclease